jgi:hypothetical protein
MLRGKDHLRMSIFRVINNFAQASQPQALSDLKPVMKSSCSQSLCTGGDKSSMVWKKCFPKVPSLRGEDIYHNTEKDHTRGLFRLG